MEKTGIRSVPSVKSFCFFPSFFFFFNLFLRVACFFFHVCICDYFCRFRSVVYFLRFFRRVYPDSRIIHAWYDFSGSLAACVCIHRTCTSYLVIGKYISRLQEDEESARTLGVVKKGVYNIYLPSYTRSRSAEISIDCPAQGINP